MHQCKVSLKRLTNVLIGLMFLTFAPSQVCGLRAPRYTSDWYWMDVNVFTSTYVVLEHNFGVYPIKSEVQIRSSSGVIYPGIQTNNNDNDHSYERGGVLCRYNDTSVELLGATNDDTCDGLNLCHALSDNAYIVHTGTIAWTSENQERETAAFVRVRLWHPSDLPDPSYEQGGITMDVMSHTFKSMPHGLGVVPVLSSVQALLPDEWMIEAQGPDSHTIKDYMNWGGLISGVNKTHFQLWAPRKTGDSSKDGRIGILSMCDGWGNFSVVGCQHTSSVVKVHFWRDLNAYHLYNNTSNHTIYTSNDLSPHELFISGLSSDTDMILVDIEASDGGYSSGFHFRAAGSVLLDGYSSGVSGVVYGYTNNSLRLWHPVFSNNYQRCMIRMSTYVGDGSLDQCSFSAFIHVNIWKLFCSPLINVPNHARLVSNHTINMTFECEELSSLTHGDLFLECIDGIWAGTLPTCEYCPPLQSGTNVLLLLPSLIGNNSAHYNCLQDHNFTSGNLHRTCIFDGNHMVWTGSPPICMPVLEEKHCLSTNTSSEEQLLQAVNTAEEMSKNLTIDVRTTKSFLRTLHSADDDRPSAQYVAAVGIFFILVVVGFIFTLDAISICQKKCHKNADK